MNTRTQGGSRKARRGTQKSQCIRRPTAGLEEIQRWTLRTQKTRSEDPVDLQQSKHNGRRGPRGPQSGSPRLNSEHIVTHSPAATRRAQTHSVPRVAPEAPQSTQKSEQTWRPNGGREPAAKRASELHALGVACQIARIYRGGPGSQQDSEKTLHKNGSQKYGALGALPGHDERMMRLRQLSAHVWIAIIHYATRVSNDLASISG